MSYLSSSEKVIMSMKYILSKNPNIIIKKIGSLDAIMVNECVHCTIRTLIKYFCIIHF